LRLIWLYWRRDSVQILHYVHKRFCAG
jgi:hypothetical protein